ncbi:MAG: glycosyltransferase family 4 protein [Elainellaceae cyanobacterium]
MTSLKIALVVENVSKLMGGEAHKVLIYLQKLQDRKHEVWLISHSRVENELREILPSELLEKTRFVKDANFQKILWQVARFTPIRLRELVFGAAINLVFQLKAKKIIQCLIEEEDIDVIFQPTPNSPLMVSALHSLNVPVVIGPLSGGMTFPPNFDPDSAITRSIVKLSQRLAGIVHLWIPGKLKADHILVANRRTREMLPKRCLGTLHEGIIECGVDLNIWNTAQITSQPTGCQTAKDVVRFVYTGRLVDWKGVDYLLDAFQRTCKDIDAHLQLIGDGEMRQTLEAKASALGVEDRVEFSGWMSHEALKSQLAACDVFVMPSLRESCGNSILEAMAVGLPAIAADWGGPGLIIDSSCGIKVSPTTPPEFVEGLANAMITLGQSAELRSKLGQAGLQRIRSQRFDWDSKVDYIVSLFEEVSQSAPPREDMHLSKC